ncbi:MAG TPA: prenyltransferase [Geobacterales bacterium]|nr:prenyltransferase [Geobacterales bacterium]
MDRDGIRSTPTNMNLKIWFLATRPWSFIMTIISASLGASLALSRFDAFLFILGTVGLILAHAATNMLNDYFDVKSKVDRPGAPTSKYRPHPYLFGAISTRDFLAVTIALYIAVIAIAIYIYTLISSVVIFLLFFGLFISIFYTIPLLPLKYKALGEPAVFIIWGPFMVGGMYYVLTKTIDLEAIIASLPIGILVALVLMANNIRDIDYDASANIKTIPIILGRKNSLTAFQILMLLPYVFAFIIAILAKPFCLISFLALPMSIRVIRTFKKQVPDNADPLVAQITLIFGILYIFGILISDIIL